MSICLTYTLIHVLVKGIYWKRPTHIFAVVQLRPPSTPTPSQQAEADYRYATRREKRLRVVRTGAVQWWGGAGVP